MNTKKILESEDEKLKKYFEIISNIQFNDKKFKNLSKLEKELKFKDNYHTTDGSEKGEIIAKDIFNFYEKAHLLSSLKLRDG